MNRNISFLLVSAMLLTLTSMPLFAADKNDVVADLDSSNPAEQVAACRKLGAAQDKSSVAKLASLMESTSNRSVAASAAAALGAIGEKGEAVDAILRVAGKTDSARIQYASILALANLRDSDKAEQIDTLVGSLAENSKDDLVKDLAQKLQTRFSK